MMDHLQEAHHTRMMPVPTSYVEKEKISMPKPSSPTGGAAAADHPLFHKNRNLLDNRRKSISPTTVIIRASPIMATSPPVLKLPRKPPISTKNKSPRNPKSPHKKTKTTKRVRDPKRKKPKDAPRRPLSAYNLFYRDEREKMMCDDDYDYPENQEIFGIAGLSKTIGFKWGNLNSESRGVYVELAKIEKEAYYEKVKAWKKQKKQKSSQDDKEQQKSNDDDDLQKKMQEQLLQERQQLLQKLELQDKEQQKSNDNELQTKMNEEQLLQERQELLQKLKLQQQEIQSLVSHLSCTTPVTTLCHYEYNETSSTCSTMSTTTPMDEPTDYSSCYENDPSSPALSLLSACDTDCTSAHDSDLDQLVQTLDCDSINLVIDIFS